MGAVVLEMDATPASQKRDEAVGHLLAASDSAYRLAFHVLGSSEAAEDAVQESYLEALGKLRAGLPAAKQRTWFLTTVVHRARDHRRGEAKRRRREAAVAGERREATSPGGEEGRTAALRGILAALDAKHRLPLVLCYQEEMTQREAAAVLQVPETTFSRHLREGLERLRSALGRAGYPAVAAAILGGLKATAPAVPASLAGRVKALAAQGPAARPANAARRLAARRGAAKGGLTMKLVAGVVLAGAIAAGVAVFSGRGGGPEPLPAEAPKKKFDIPVWHPDARWEKPKEPFAHATRVPGILDGPRREVMSIWKVMPTLMGGFVGSGRYVFLSYDEKTERFHPATRGARGNLDGPFSRARFSYGNYHDFHMHAPANDGRFYYMVANWWTGWVRALDFATQTVSTLPAEGIAVTPGESGKVYLVNGRRPVSEVTVLSPGPEWKVLSKTPLQGKQAVGGLGFVLAVDEKRGRLYGTTYRADPWYVWYWDLADGSYHGVLPNCQQQEGKRRQGEAGPFKGTVVYNHGEIGWGPDDPEKRHLYMTRVDDASLYRLDLDREVLMVFNDKEGRFVDHGRGTRGTYGRMPLWLGDGSFVGSVPTFPGNIINRFRRVK